MSSIANNFPQRPTYFYRAIPDGQGGLWASGLSIVSGVSNQLSGALIRLDLSSGQPVSGFSFASGASSVMLLDVFDDGSALVVTDYGYDAFVRKVFVDGTFDPDFQPFSVRSPRVGRILSNGQIIIASRDTADGPTAGGAYVYRLNADGQIDNTWNPVALGYKQSQPETNVWARVLEDASGSILIGGSFSSVNEVAIDSIARLLPNGNVDSTFHAALPIAANRAIRGLGLDSEGRILVAARFTSSTNPNILGPGILRLHADGSVDSTFNAPTSISGSMGINDLIIDANDRIIAVGTMGGIRLLPDGQLDPSFSQVMPNPLPSELWGTMIDNLFGIEPW
ncbi:MAG: hypothetical protein LR015_11350 [Verrucomicrobia bacterium]|nr:hypothetical protein [Verrucomicrobiota bacterium]